MPRHTSAACTAEVRTGYWCEAVRYRDTYDDRPELLDRIMLGTPEAAIRLIHTRIRTGHPFSLSPTDTDQALVLADRGSRIHALAALHRGEPAGFNLTLHDGLRIGWRVLPIRHLAVTMHGLPTPRTAAESEAGPGQQPNAT
ncbi:hypothetical protein [Streptomyces sp. NPDC089799]|uniref:hypothetical protein n=1 Tax=Streptomyces sp. NPDC089799 TaxID=3155066 RepID=UPI003431E223